MNRINAIEKMNRHGSRSRPFIFIIDYTANNPIVLSLEDADKEGIKYQFHNQNPSAIVAPPYDFEKMPVSFSTYAKAFHQIHNELRYGNTYLVNLTVPTDIKTTLTLDQIFELSQAPYKLLVPDNFVIFSPESFVKIEDGLISTYPMKGTIKADLPDAEQSLLSDPKEQAEHATIVDLLRNDLSMVSKRVKVKKYRYVEKIKKPGGDLLQVSSEIEGQLDSDYKSRLGDIVFKLLPAGSVTGAPKEKTVEIIRRVENYERGYFAGVFGYFDGEMLESAVSIRFIEKAPSGYLFKSGGGITAQSEVIKEYEEMLDKIYVPII